MESQDFLTLGTIFKTDLSEKCAILKNKYYISSEICEALKEVSDEVAKLSQLVKYIRGFIRTTLFFSSKILFFHLSLDFWKFDVFSSNFSSMKMLLIDGAILRLKFYEFREINYTSSQNIERYLSIYYSTCPLLLFNPKKLI